MIKAHGGVLINQLMAEGKREEALRASINWPKLELSKEQAKTVENIATGVYSPLKGFMGKEELDSVLSRCRLTSGEVWTLPVLLPVPEDKAEGLESSGIALTYNGDIIAQMFVKEVYRYKRRELAEAVYGTSSQSHPGVCKVMAYPPYFIAGEISLINFPATEFPQYKFTPRQTRDIFLKKGWEKVVAFQTRNAPHMGHEYIQKSALAICDGLFINPVLGKKKKGDFTDAAIIQSYQALLKNYFPEKHSMLAVLEYEMEYAGPKEAIHHAIMRKNFGCTHMIIGRDHAGVGNFYTPYGAQEIFKSFPDLEIEPVIFNSVFYCTKCEAIAHDKICPHNSERHIDFSGTKIRDFFINQKSSLKGSMRPEVIKSILELPEYFV